VLNVPRLRKMDDCDLADYCFPESARQFPEKVPEMAKEARKLLRTKRGRAALESLRNEWEEMCKAKGLRREGVGSAC